MKLSVVANTLLVMQHSRKCAPTAEKVEALALAIEVVKWRAFLHKYTSSDLYQLLPGETLE